MEMMNLKDVKNFKGVRSIETNMNSLVFRGKRINRIETANNVNNGTYYALPTLVQLNVGTSMVVMVELTPRIIKMINEGNSRYICIVKEQTLGTFSVSFDNLRKGKFEKVVEEELNRYFENMNEIRVDYETTLKNKDEQIKIKEHQLGKALSEKQEYQFKYAKESKEHDDTKDNLIKTQNALMVVKTELVDAQKEIELLKGLKKERMFNRGTLRVLIRKIVTLYNNGTTIDKLVDYVLEFLEK